MKNFTSILVALFVMMGAMQANASDNGGVGLGAKIGTLGFGINLNYPVNSILTIGLEANKYAYSADQTDSGIKYHSNIDLQTFGVIANIHPFAGSFHFTAGLMQNNNKFSMTAASSTTYDINGTTYTSAQVGKLTGTVEFRKYAPYAGVGWGFSSSSGIGFTLEIGALMQGKPNVDLTSKGGTLSTDPTFQSELKKEEASTEDDIKGFTTYPVVSAGIDFRF